MIMRILKCLYWLFFNRLMMSVIILAIFLFDYRIVAVKNWQFYYMTSEVITVIDDQAYYQMPLPFSEDTRYVVVTYGEGRTSLDISENIPTHISVLHYPIVWWYYLGALTIVFIFPFKWFRPKKRKKKTDLTK